MSGLSETTFTPEEQAQFDAMKTGDAGTADTAQQTPAPAAAAQPVTETPKDPDDPEVVDGKVPYNALRAERERRKEFQKQVEEGRAERAKLAGRFEVLEQLARQASQKPEEQIPDYNQDPAGYLRAKNEQSERELADLRAWKQQTEQHATVQNNVRGVAQIAMAHEAEFKKANPDYEDAASYMRNLRDQYWQVMGVTDPAQRQQAINNDALQLALTALNSNRNTAQVVYDLAKAQGWTAKGGAAQPSPAEQKVAMAARGQQQGGGIGQANGAAAPELTLAAIADMSDADFAEATKGGNWKKLMTTAKAR